MGRWLGVLVLWSGVSFAGPGFDGVGDRGPMPSFEGPGAANVPGSASMQVGFDDAQEQKVLEMVKEFDPKRTSASCV